MTESSRARLSCVQQTVLLPVKVLPCKHGFVHPPIPSREACVGCSHDSFRLSWNSAPFPLTVERLQFSKTYQIRMISILQNQYFWYFSTISVSVYFFYCSFQHQQYTWSPNTILFYRLSQNQWSTNKSSWVQTPPGSTSLTYFLFLVIPRSRPRPISKEHLHSYVCHRGSGMPDPNLMSFLCCFSVIFLHTILMLSREKPGNPGDLPTLHLNDCCGWRQMCVMLKTSQRT